MLTVVPCVLPRLLLVLPDDELLDAGLDAGLAAGLDGWSIGRTEHGDAAVADAGAFAAIVVDLRREPFDGWFTLARLGALVDGPMIVAIGNPRSAPRALRLGAVAVVSDPARLGDAIAGFAVTAAAA
jgi:hypothetical protein